MALDFREVHGGALRRGNCRKEAHAGLAAWLLGVREPSRLRNHPLRGALCETWVVAELFKAAHNRGRPPALSFYRTRDGAEVDIIAETPLGCTGIEVKSGATVGGGENPARSLRGWKNPLDY